MTFLAELSKGTNLIKRVPENDPPAEQFDLDVLDAAVYLNDIPLVKRLLSQDPSLGWRPPGSLTNSALDTRLKLTAYHGNLEMTEILLAADPILVTPIVRLPACFFSKLVGYNSRGTEGHRDVFHFAMETCYSARDDGIVEATMHATPFLDVFKRAEKILGLENEIFGPPKWGRHLLRRMFTSASHGQLEMVRHCLERGVDLNMPFADSDVEYVDWTYSQDRKILLYAVEGGHYEVTKLLLMSGADPNLFDLDNTALQTAVHRGNIPIARLLVAHGASLNDGCPPPIVVAVRTENVEMFEYLRSAGAVLDTPDTGPWAMAFAQAFELDSMVNLLCHEGVDRDVVYFGCPMSRYTLFTP